MNKYFGKFIFWLLITTMFAISSCKPHGEPPKEDYSGTENNYTRIDNGRVGFILPPGSEVLPDLQEALHKMNETVICVLKLNAGVGSSDILSVARYAGDTAVPMEIAFIEKTVKTVAEYMGCKSSLIDFGVFDKEGKRFRYKVVKIDGDCFRKAIGASWANAPGSDSMAAGSASKKTSGEKYRILYYFMKNDMDSVMYEISMNTDSENYFKTDSLLIKFAHSFRFYD